MPEEKQLTMDELKQVIVDSVKDSELAKQVEALCNDFSVLKTVKAESKEGRAAISAKFVKDLMEDNKAELKTITTNTGSFGYSVPTELATAVHEKKDKIAKIRKNAFVFQMDGKFDLPTEGTGVTAYWVTTEVDADLTESNPTVGKKSLDDYYLAARVRVPYKLLQTSGINVEDYVSKLSSRSLVSKEETAFVAGSGSDQPTGIRTASITGISQAGANLAYDDLVNLFYGVPEQYRANGKWLIPTGALKLIRKLKDVSGLPIFNVEDNKIFGKEVLECTDIPENLGTSANETEIYFGDLQEYWIKDGQSMFAEQRPVQGRLQVDLYLYEACDGCVVNTDAFRKLQYVK